MPQSYFRFKQFTVQQDRCAMKVTTDACLFGAWAAHTISQNTARAASILDIGTGTGLLSLMLAQKTFAQLDAIELDPDAAGQAAENFGASPWADRLHVTRGDARNDLPNHRYDIVVSNPPFYEQELTSHSATRNLAHHGDGLSLKDLVRVIKQALAPGGQFFLLAPEKRAGLFMAALQEQQLFVDHVVRVQQSPRHGVFRVMMTGSCEPVNHISEQEITICDEAGKYTPDFVQLLKDYYLYL